MGKERFRFNIVERPGDSPSDPIEYGWVLYINTYGTFYGRKYNESYPICRSEPKWKTVAEARNAADTFRRQAHSGPLSVATIAHYKPTPAKQPDDEDDTGLAPPRVAKASGEEDEDGA